MWPNMENTQLISPKGVWGESQEKWKADFFLKIQLSIECTWF